MTDNVLSNVPNTHLDAFSVDAGSLSGPYDRLSQELEERGFVDALWTRSLDVWGADATVRSSIGHRLGWLGAVEFLDAQAARLEGFAASVRSGGFTDVLLLGMGGSSLAPEVIRQVLGVTADVPRFRMLDSVDPEAVQRAMDRPAETLFIIASKSGSTIEPNVMAAEAQRRLIAAGFREWGPRFGAITDEGTPLYERAMNERFRDLFVNPSDIGGRYSALTFFGMVPAALMGVDLERLTAHARGMEHACRQTHLSANPGVALGALIAAGAMNGRDKLTLLLPDRLRSFGLWVEQLIAESTGKAGKGVVPITGESADAPFGDDRIAVVVNVGTERVEPAVVDRVRSAHLPLATIDMPETLALGAEFLRWEVATATAGALIGINPFDEPNVQQAKDATRALLDIYSHDRRLPAPEPLASIGGAHVSASRAAQDRLGAGGTGAFLRLLERGDYFALLAYLPPDDPRFDSPLRDLRSAVGSATGCATMFGYGPRYLHSTGQLHKGGRNTGVFLIVAADTAADLPVPDAPYSFGVLEMAQAIGDFQSLDRAGRRALYVHFPDRDPGRLRALTAALLAHIS